MRPRTPPAATQVMMLEPAIEAACAVRGWRFVSMRREARGSVVFAVGFGESVYGSFTARVTVEPEETVGSIDDKLYDEAVRLLDQRASEGAK